MDNLKKLLRYWHDSLVDSSRLGINFRGLNNALKVRSSDLKKGRAILIDTKKSENLEKLFKTSDTQTTGVTKCNDRIPVLVTPLVFLPKFMRGEPKSNSRQSNSPLCPVWVSAILSKDNTITPSENGITWIARELLESSAAELPFTSESTIIGSVEDLDLFLTDNPGPTEQLWATYLSYAHEMFKAVTTEATNNTWMEDFKLATYAVILPSEKIAQKGCFYKDKNERGVFLSEHRRCVPEIIAYCNELAYNGKLEPKRSSITNPVLPALGYAHIPGKAMTHGMSRYNELEAAVIARWLKENGRVLCLPTIYSPMVTMRSMHIDISAIFNWTPTNSAIPPKPIASPR